MEPEIQTAGEPVVIIGTPDLWFLTGNDFLRGGKIATVVTQNK